MPPRRETAVSEEELLATVTQMAEAFGWMVYHTRDSRRSETGFPDLVLVRPPVVWIVELKREDAKLTQGRYNRKGTWLPGQEDWMDLLKDCGTVRSAVWRPSGLDGIEEDLR